MRELGDDQALTVVVGNKLDKEKDRVILESDGASFARENNAAFFEISAKTGYNVQEVFDTLINRIYKDIKSLEGNAKSFTNTQVSHRHTTHSNINPSNIEPGSAQT
jgi:GTPase SAR1 family protein